LSHASCTKDTHDTISHNTTIKVPAITQEAKDTAFWIARVGGGNFAIRLDENDKDQLHR